MAANAGNLQTFAAGLVQREGGPVVLKDGAGQTWIGGQTHGWLSQWGFSPPANADEAESNVLAWLSTKQPLLGQLLTGSLALGTACCDWIYNSPPTVVTAALQQILGVTVDGDFGPKTLAAALSGNTAHVASLLHLARLRFLGTAVAKGEIDPCYAEDLIGRVCDLLTPLV